MCKYILVNLKIYFSKFIQQYETHPISFSNILSNVALMIFLWSFWWTLSTLPLYSTLFFQLCLLYWTYSTYFHLLLHLMKGSMMYTHLFSGIIMILEPKILKTYYILMNYLMRFLVLWLFYFIAKCSYKSLLTNDTWVVHFFSMRKRSIEMETHCYQLFGTEISARKRALM